MNDPMMIRTKDHDIVKIVIKGSYERINVMSIDNLFFISIWSGDKLTTYLTTITIYFFKVVTYVFI